MHSCIHITENGEVIGTIGLNKNGQIVDDGSNAAKFAIHGINHKKTEEDGQELLDAIVKHLDRSTLLNAVHCDPSECSHLDKHGSEPDNHDSTTPSEVNNPEDHIPEFGSGLGSPKDHGVQISNDWVL
jgi:hypothetical protein